MDQLKEILGVLRRQHFWFIAPILLIVGLVGWMMANKQLTQEYEANKSKVQSYISQMQSVSSQQPHPNTDYESGMEQLIAQRRDNVRAAWERKWERQKQELKWPDDLPPEFVSIVDQMRPIEKVDVDRRPIPSLMRRTYQGFIKEMLPRLAKRIGAQWEPSNMGRFGGFGGGDFRSEARATPTEGRWRSGRGGGGSPRWCCGIPRIRASSNNVLTGVTTRRRRSKCSTLKRTFGYSRR